MKFILASQNRHKLVEMQNILSAHGVEVVLQGDLGLHVEVEETGSSFAENAMLKAKAVMEASGLPAIADDSGVCVDALNGAPGVYSARYGGPELDDAGRYQLLLNNLRGATNRAAHFTRAIACSHAGACRCFTMHLGDPNELLPHGRVPNCAILHFTYEDGRFSLEEVLVP